MQVRYIVGDAPLTPDGHAIPDDYEIHTAPRPLYGEVTWWCKETWHTAIMRTSDPDNQELLDRNERLGAERAVFVSKEAAVEWSRCYYATQYPEEWSEMQEYADERMLLGGFANHRHEFPVDHVWTPELTPV